MCATQLSLPPSRRAKRARPALIRPQRWRPTTAEDWGILAFSSNQAPSTASNFAIGRNGHETVLQPYPCLIALQSAVGHSCCSPSASQSGCQTTHQAPPAFPVPRARPPLSNHPPPPPSTSVPSLRLERHHRRQSVLAHTTPIHPHHLALPKRKSKKWSEIKSNTGRVGIAAVDGLAVRVPGLVNSLPYRLVMLLLLYTITYIHAEVQHPFVQACLHRSPPRPCWYIHTCTYRNATALFEGRPGPRLAAAGPTPTDT